MKILKNIINRFRLIRELEQAEYELLKSIMDVVTYADISYLRHKLNNFRVLSRDRKLAIIEPLLNVNRLRGKLGIKPIELKDHIEF